MITHYAFVLISTFINLTNNYENSHKVWLSFSGASNTSEIKKEVNTKQWPLNCQLIFQGKYNQGY